MLIYQSVYCEPKDNNPRYSFSFPATKSLQKHPLKIYGFEWLSQTTGVQEAIFKCKATKSPSRLGPRISTLELNLMEMGYMD
jgi:hypothetical protein